MARRGLTRRGFFGLGAATLAGAAPWRRTGAAAGLTGQVITPADAGYDDARLDFNLRFSRFPEAIVICSSAADVQNAVRWARENALPFRARSGGHSYEAYSVLDGGLVIDVSGLRDIAVDTSRGEAVVGAGVQLLDLYRRLWHYGVTVPGGTCPGVGIAGLTLGGGIGFLSRQYGLTCDNLVAVDLVSAEGILLRASEQEHPELFWALRGGGGGNFGIATAFTFRVHAIDEVALVTVSWPWDDLAVALEAWQQWAPAIDPRLAAGFFVPKPEVGFVSSTMLLNGGTGELRALLKPLLQTGTPSPPQISTVPFLTAAEQLAGPDLAHSRFKNTGAFVDTPLTGAAIATFVAQMRAAPPGDNLVGFFAAGGRIGAVAPEATAFVHRRALFDIQYQAYWPGDSDGAAGMAWVRAIRAAMAPYASGSYVNYIDAELTDWADAYYGVNLPRLQQVKAQYDPDNVFNGPQAIPALPQ